jgi:RNA polymerase sigma factor for flagellar operon FliA
MLHGRNDHEGNGGILGINESRVSQIHKSALEKMQVALESNGISSAQAF